MQLTVQSFPRGYRDILDSVVAYGCRVAPRGDATLELLNVTVTVTDTTCALPVGTGRKVGTRLADEEALQLIAGVSHPEHKRFTADHVSDPNLECYGPLTRDGIERSVRYLQEDPSTRRACVNLGHVGGDSGYPCLASLGWLLRRGRLHAFSEWRSNDAWVGMPYDVHAVAALQRTIASFLGVAPGPLHHRARSLHIYEKHLPLVEGVGTPETWRPTAEIDSFLLRLKTWDEVRGAAAVGLDALHAPSAG